MKNEYENQKFHKARNNVFINGKKPWAFGGTAGGLTGVCLAWAYAEALLAYRDESLLIDVEELLRLCPDYEELIAAEI